MDVQPYAVTTKFLFVGYTYYKYLRYHQVIDTPGILNRPIEDPNIIEITAIQLWPFQSCSIVFPWHFWILWVQYCTAAGSFRHHQVIGRDFWRRCEAGSWYEIRRVSQQTMRTCSWLWALWLKGQEGVIAVKNVACDGLLDQNVELKMKSKSWMTAWAAPILQCLSHMSRRKATWYTLGCLRS